MGGIIAAEMKMYVYRTKSGGKKYRVITPTGNTIVAAWNKASLSPHILDPTFASVARQFNLTVMEEDQILNWQGMMCRWSRRTAAAALMQLKLFRMKSMCTKS